MPEMNIVQAVNSALDIMLEKDPDVIFFGKMQDTLAEFSDLRWFARKAW